MRKRNSRASNRRTRRNRVGSNPSLVQKINSMSNTKKIIGAATIVTVLAAGAAGVLAGMYSNNNEIDSSYSSVIEDPREIGDGNVTFQGVLDKRVSAEDYLNHLSSTMPEILEAKKEGFLQGIYYDPSDKQLEKIALQHFANIDMPIDGDFQAFLESIIDYSNTMRTRKTNRISTVREGLSGKGNYSFMLVWPTVFKKGNFVKEEDFRLAMRHELFHTRDAFYGISYDGVLIDDTKLSDNFLVNLGELRATAVEIEYILNHPNEISPEYTSNRLNIFVKWRDNMCPINEYETEIKKKQLAELPISVTVKGNSLRGYFKDSEKFVEAKYTKHKIPNYCLK
ncbi:MAG: hypothetical protein IH934_01740 [Nanoarchaeota archaeon]|nr:hypothetical protein [Nanoarchaeota archaeon]